MKMRISIAATAMALATPLLAQTLPEAQISVPVDYVTMPITWEAPLISGHPYSAMAKTVTRSPDGQHIDRSSIEMVYRDDQGRLRREINGGKNVSVLDPAAGIGYNLNTTNKTAMKRTLAPAMIELQTQLPKQSLLEIEKSREGSRPNTVVEDLGMQVINGVSAQGVRTTTTTPAGTFGNDRDLKTVVERWVSNDLHVLVKSVTTDSRSGPTTYELTNLVMASPDPALFQVPAGYTVQEGGRRGGAVMAVPTGGRK